MLLIHTESSQDSVNQKGRILLVLSYLKNCHIKSLYIAAILYKIPRSILTNCTRGIVSYINLCPIGYKLTKLEEELLIKQIIDLYRAVSRLATVREIANILLTIYGSYPLPTISKN
jgi:hypothetical protein